MKEHKLRCAWVTTESIYIDYHDQEWGKPIYDDQQLFEFLMLEGMQAGLSWITVLKKRQAFRESFDGFDPAKIAHYRETKINRLLTNEKIIRNRLKINAVVSNAEAYLKLLEQHDSFRDYLWDFVDGKPIQNHWPDHAAVPAMTETSDKLSKALKQQGFKFVGSTICYAFMQAVGMVNDHTQDCFLYGEKNV